MENDDDANTIPIQTAKDWLESLAKGQEAREIETQALQDLYSVRVWRGLIRCNFIVPQSLSDKDGNWHVGAIATLIDIIGATVEHTSFGKRHVSVDSNVSYFSTARVQEEVEIEAKGHKGNLSSVVVVIKKKENGDLVAIGKEWMSAFNHHPKSKM
ncbi:uncharacterized protein LOC113306715 isoform X2 [Papaver somniferum]|uniref:uncharacterized protein LOC113306715 isoform X2 n=1 Tax=Papaver somniferum TaxID=3469 RepID=UPI000E6F67FE|nr:uncharacterized protein LOC113306715 isoform X2 [Papaver somniferum]XP_026411413.1 uncharacterized protein LOC113306715 isoform X2 [Papaver somniferum]